MYLFAGILNTDMWWGISGDSFVVHEKLHNLGVDTYLTVGDQDRAIEIMRGELIRGGMSLSQVTMEICKRLSVGAIIVPMTDSQYTTMIKTPNETIHFQEYWVKHRGNVPVIEVVRQPQAPPEAADAATEAIHTSELVIIGPSNPVTSIMPILECGGIVQALKRKTVVAISPFIGDNPVSGPARDLMIAKGLEPTSAGVHAAYLEFIDYFIQDIRDPVSVPGAVRCDTLMTNSKVAADIMQVILDLV
jgi:LPPG:FO 2-phospho-L-lactate transferase